MRLTDLGRDYELKDPPWARMLFANTMMAPLWLIVRAFLGFQWLEAGWHKVTGNGWINQDGASLKSFWDRIVQVPAKGSPPIVYDWYRDFIQFMLDQRWYSWFAWVIAVGEVVIGVMLIVGMLTGFAALAGATMNFNFMLAGSASTNPMLFLLAVLVLLGWKVAGRIGVDRWLLPALGTPWEMHILDARDDARRGAQPAG
ncbi:MAG: DoxX family protein [Dehalococcoidia bacterium]